MTKQEPVSVNLLPIEIEGVMVMLGSSAIEFGFPEGPFKRFNDHFNTMCSKHGSEKVMEVMTNHAISGVQKLIAAFDEGAEKAGWLEK